MGTNGVQKKIEMFFKPGAFSDAFSVKSPAI